MLPDLVLFPRSSAPKTLHDCPRSEGACFQREWCRGASLARTKEAVEIANLELGWSLGARLLGRLLYRFVEVAEDAETV